MLITLLSINFVYADEYPEITKDIEIRYKWYKDVIVPGGKYIPKDEITQNDIINENDFYYSGRYSQSNPKYCELSPKNYEITKQIYTTYKKVPNTTHVLVENISYTNNIKIYYDKKLIDFNIISSEQNKIKIDLKGNYLSELLMFFVDTNEDYKISLYSDSAFLRHTLSKNINKEKISIPDKTWITEQTEYESGRALKKFIASDLTTIILEEEECIYRDILVYRYNTERQYYDDNYHVYVEGYLKDTNDYKFYYKGEPIKEEPIIQTIEIIKEKLIKEAQIEYVYIEKDNKKNIPQIEYVYIEKTNNENEQKNDSSNNEIGCLPEVITKTEIKKEIVEKEIHKIPKIIYVIGLILIMSIIFLIIKKRKKYVD